MALSIYPERNINVWNKFQVNQSIKPEDISLKTTNVSLMVALEEMSGDHQIH